MTWTVDPKGAYNQKLNNRHRTTRSARERDAVPGRLSGHKDRVDAYVACRRYRHSRDASRPPSSRRRYRSHPFALR